MNSRELMSLTVRELREMCYWRGLVTYGSKFEVMTRLMNWEMR